MASTTSAARIAANRLNALRSTGPRTNEGKARARANAVKHGLTGAGIALPTEDAAVVAARFVELQEEMAPSSLEAALLVRQMALMSVRIDRAALQETAALAQTIRHATTEFELNRLAEIDHLYATIETNPGEHRRRLLLSAEGINRLTTALGAVRDQLRTGTSRIWGETERAKVSAFLGATPDQFPASRTDALLAALNGSFLFLTPDDLARCPQPAQRTQAARDELIRLINAEMAHLATRLAHLDPTVVALDRQEAAARAHFNPSPEAVLARKYEAAAYRLYLRSSRDFHDLEAATPLPPEAEPAAPELAPNPTAPPIIPDAVADADTPAPEPASAPPVAAEEPADLTTDAAPAGRLAAPAWLPAAPDFRSSNEPNAPWTPEAEATATNAAAVEASTAMVPALAVW